MKAKIGLFVITHMKPHWYKPKPEPLLAPTIDIRKTANKKITMHPHLEARDVGVIRMKGTKIIVSKPI